MDGPGGPRRGEGRNQRYDRNFRYARDFRYDRDFGRGDADRGPVPGEAYAMAPYPLPPFAGMRWGWDPSTGWGAWGPGMPVHPFAPMPPGPPRHEPPPMPPQRSPMYGHGGDEALRRWAGRYGYDFGPEIHPRPPRRRGYEW